MTHHKRRLSPKRPIPRRSLFDQIPKSRQPFYAALLGIFSFVGVCGASGELYLALMSGQIVTFTGPKGQRIKEIIFYDVEPTRFGWNVAGTVFMILVLATAAMMMLRRLLKKKG
ncbi:hypothetical protein [Pseudomonas sp. PS02290]|uniref:hypothetical protein n=1 Tax=Pseudomonas sp. PS02290 TaxID=2991430 RepID=UPI00249BC807|nr:hypothetical protein [Pseudomonas sp. PS02290]